VADFSEHVKGPAASVKCVYCFVYKYLRMRFHYRVILVNYISVNVAQLYPSEISFLNSSEFISFFFF
jgi:hypothetical protein